MNYSLAPTYLKVSATRMGFMVFQLLHLVVLAAFVHFDKYQILIFSGLFNLIIYSLLFVREIRVVNYVSPLHFYLLASILRMGICCVYIGFVLLKGFEEVIQIGPIVPIITDYLIHGHMILMLGDMAFISGYWAIKNNARSNMTRNLYFNNQFFLIFWIAILLLLLKIFDFQFGRISYYLLTYGPPGCLYVMLKSFGSSNGKTWYVKASLVLLVTIILVMISLRSYMKSDILIALFPFILIYAEKYRERLKKKKVFNTTLRTLSLVVILSFFTATITTYSEVRRAFIGGEINIAKSVEVTPFLLTGILASIPGTEEFDRFNTFPTGGAWNFLKRLTVTNLGAWSYQEVGEFGYWDRNFLNDLLLSIVPRVFWPDKPNFWPGRDFATKVGHADSPETASTSTALTMAASFYWWGGIFAVILGMSTSGLLVAASFRFVQHRQTSNPVAALIAIVLFFSSLLWFEGAYFGTIQLFLFIAIIFAPLIIIYESLVLRRNQQQVITRQ